MAALPQCHYILRDVVRQVELFFEVDDSGFVALTATEKFHDFSNGADMVERV